MFICHKDDADVVVWLFLVVCCASRVFARVSGFQLWRVKQNYSSCLVCVCALRVLYAPELQKHASPGIVIALVGNKSDLAADRAVSREEAAALAAENNMAGGCTS